MSEMFGDCKRLKKLMAKKLEELERKGVKIYHNVAEMEEQTITDVVDDHRPLLLLNNPSMLKVLSMSEINEIRKTGVVPDDLEQRLTKQLKLDEKWLSKKWPCGRTIEEAGEK